MAGIRYITVEEEAKLNYRSNEWTMAIHWSLDRLEKFLPPKLWAKLAATTYNPSVPMEAGGIRHSIHGGHASGRNLRQGIEVPKNKMRALCAEGIDVQYGKNLSDAAFNETGNGVIATFSDSTLILASILLGIDDPRSKVREIAMLGTH